MSLTSKVLKISLFASLIILLTFSEGLSITKNAKKLGDNNSAKFTILYDNYKSREDAKTAWGFSCLIESNNKTILFDTGGKEDILKHNIEKLNVDISKIDYIVISHEHWDHFGGLRYILQNNSKVTVYLPASFSKNLVSKIKELGAKAVKVDKPLKITESIHLTGEMNNVEQSLIIDTPKGSVIVSGCSHQGIVHILEKSKEINNKNIYLVFGGFHLLNHSEEDVNTIIKKFESMKVENCGATHCTGDSQIKQFKNAFGENYFSMGVGRLFIVSKKGIELKDN